MASVVDHFCFMTGLKIIRQMESVTPFRDLMAYTLSYISRRGYNAGKPGERCLAANYGEYLPQKGTSRCSSAVREIHAGL